MLTRLRDKTLVIQHPERDRIAVEIERLQAERDELFKTNGELANTVVADALRLRDALQRSHKELLQYAWYDQGLTGLRERNEKALAIKP